MWPSDYVIKATTDPSDDTCFVALISAPEEMPIFVLGDSFMRGFYTIHADDTGMLGLVPHSLSQKRAPLYEPNPPHSRHINATGMADLTE